MPEPEKKKDPRILIVDDDGVILKILARRFSTRGYKVFTAGDGDQALDSLKAARPDAVLLDVNLPRLDGLAVLREMLEVDPTLPVFMISGMLAASEESLFINEGARAFIHKPFDYAELEKAVESSLAGG